MKTLIRPTAAISAVALLAAAAPARAEPMAQLNLNAPALRSFSSGGPTSARLLSDPTGDTAVAVGVGVLLGAGLVVGAGYLLIKSLQGFRGMPMMG